MASKLVNDAMKAVGAVGLALLAACGSSTSPSSSGGGGGASGGGGHSTTITVGDNTFTPTPDTVSAGTVTFTWAGSNQHNVTWDSGPTPLPTNSPTQTTGSYNAALRVGTYQYHCVVHGSVMSGTIVVH
jgi:plastocyanin